MECNQWCTFCAPGNSTEADPSSVSGGCNLLPLYNSTCVTYTYSQADQQYRARYMCGEFEGAELVCSSGNSWCTTSGDCVDSNDVLPSSAIPLDCGSCQDITVLDQQNLTTFCNMDVRELTVFASPDPNRVVHLDRYIGLFNIIVDTAIGSMQCANATRELMCRYIFPVCDGDELPRAPCPSYCSCILDSLCASEIEQMRELAHQSFAVLGDESPFSILVESLIPANCSNASLSFYNVSYSSSCMELDQSQNPNPSPSRDLEKILIITIVPSVSVVVALVLGLCCVCYCWQRRKNMSQNYPESIDSYPPSGGCTGPLLSLCCPFVHPRHSKVEAKRDLLKLVPRKYKEVISKYQQYLIQPSCMHTTMLLAEGTHVEVYQGYVVDLHPHQTSTHRNVAIKKFKEHVSHPDIVDYLDSCLKISNVNHPSVIKVIAVTFDEQGSVSIAYPYMEEHDLLTYLRKKRASIFSQIGSPTDSENFTVQTLVDIVLQIANGMKAISEDGISYKMLRASTCLVDRGPRIVVGDNCISSQMSLRGVSCDERFSCWMAPEGFKEKRFTEKCDVWSFGITCWEVFALGATPYHEIEKDLIMNHVLTGNRLNIPPLCPPSIFSLMERCWEEDPKKRPFFYEIVKELSSLQQQPVLRTEIQRIDEALKRGSIELVGSLVIPNPLALEPMYAVSRFSHTSSQASFYAYIPAKDSSLSQSSIAGVKQEEVSLLRESRMGPRGSPIHSRGSNSPIHVQMNPALEVLSPFEELEMSTEVSSDEETDGYVNSRIGISLRRHSIDVPPRPREDVPAYYNLPKGYFTLLRGKRKSRSSNDLTKIGDSQLSVASYQHGCSPSSRTETVTGKPPKVFPKPPRLPLKLFPRPAKPPPRRKFVLQNAKRRRCNQKKKNNISCSIPQ